MSEFANGNMYQEGLLKKGRPLLTACPIVNGCNSKGSLYGILEKKSQKGPSLIVQKRRGQIGRIRFPRCRGHLFLYRLNVARKAANRGWRVTHLFIPNGRSGNTAEQSVLLVSSNTKNISESPFHRSRVTLKFLLFSLCDAFIIHMTLRHEDISEGNVAHS